MELRPMTMEDADKMLEWKNYAETRKFAIQTSAEIKREDHIKFLGKNLQYFQIIQVDGEVVGAIRIQDKEVSVWIDKKFWGRHFATEAIKMVSKEGFTAKIMLRNLMSMRAFISCGYKPVEYVEGITIMTDYYIYKL